MTWLRADSRSTEVPALLDRTIEENSPSAADKTESSLGSHIVPYPAIERHGVIGDRRTAALVAADGTMDWLCLPDYDGDVFFGALLDGAKGGFWRVGPAGLEHGQQTYEDDSMVLQTQWTTPDSQLVLRDCMLWPDQNRAPEQISSRVLVRSLACVKGHGVRCELRLLPGYNFKEQPIASLEAFPSGVTIKSEQLALRLWSSTSVELKGPYVTHEFELSEGNEFWAVLELGPAGHDWSVESARAAMAKSRSYWREWLKCIRYSGPGKTRIRRSTMLVHLLTYAPEGSAVAAPSTSVPERIGGKWNADYRLSWVRDTSLALGTLEGLGDWKETERYLQWLCARQSPSGAPLQVLYGIRGERRPRQKILSGAAGYRGSKPVRVGNHAYHQFQLGSVAFLADCMWLYVQANGQWREEYWKLLRRIANYTVKHWMDPDNGLWELQQRQHYVYSRVLSWVALDRAVCIAGKVNPKFDPAVWRAELPKIHNEVMERGWSERLGAFRQRYESDNLDAATLLISVLDFLPPEHPRVLATIDKIHRFLAIDDCVYRFDPLATALTGAAQLGEFEGAFLPCTFWLATAYAKASQPDRAEAIIAKVEKVAGPLGIFAEAIDPRNATFRGNSPLLFSHVEYIRAKIEIARARDRQP
jgi:GH15 family glucan-1,4-alpha-glucosidase